MRSVAVVGTGLIGTSNALALRDQGVATYLLDRDPEAARTAAARGRAARASQSIRWTWGCWPCRLDRSPPCWSGSNAWAWHVTSDVANVKEVRQTRAAHRGCDLSRYVGGHPMAGKEQSGPLAACAVPHLVAGLLAGRLLHGDEDQLALAEQGLRDATRIAGGDAELWSDILGSNAPAVAEVLHEVAKDLEGVIKALCEVAAGPADASSGGSTAALAAALARGVQVRAGIPDRPRAADNSAARLPGSDRGR